MTTARASMIRRTRVSAASASSLQGLLAGIALAVAGGVSAQGYPVKPIRVLSEYNAGAGGDVFFRSFAVQLAAATEQQWVVDNRPGAGGLLAVQAAMRSPADGYTVLIASQNVPVTRRYLSRSKPIEANVDLTPISALWRTTLVIASHPSFQPKSLKELIA